MKIAIVVQHHEDIRGAERQHPRDCPVSRAIRRRLGLSNDGLSRMSVLTFVRAVSFVWVGPNISVALPFEVSTRLINYDAGQIMEPFTFLLDLPDALGLLAPPLPALTTKLSGSVVIVQNEIHENSVASRIRGRKFSAEELRARRNLPPVFDDIDEEPNG